MLYLGERLASALAYVHERGILHRDLKPSNVVICPNGEPVLIDFNLAQDRSMSEHRLGGTLPYMPPEQLAALATRRSGDVILADHRGDIYALGVILYELLTGRHPFGPVPLKLKTAAARDFLISKQQEGPRLLRSRNRAIDPALDRLILRCLSANPDDRPATARELAAELAKLQAPIRRARRWAGAHVMALTLIGAFLASGTAAGTYVATRPSAAVVHSQEGDRNYSNGKYAAAIEEYSLSLVADKNQPAVYFARGRAFQKTGEFRSAANDFERADPESDGQAAARLAYCWTKTPDHEHSIKWYETAIAAKPEGVNLAVLHNNAAFSLSRMAKREDWEAAEEHATQALRQDPTLRAAYFNRAWIRYRLWFAGAGNNAADGLADARMAISLGGDGTAFLYYIAAALCAADLNDAGNPAGDPRNLAGLEYVKKAVAHGYEAKRLSRRLKKHPLLADWAALLQAEDVATQPPTGMDEDLRLIEPFTD